MLLRSEVSLQVYLKDLEHGALRLLLAQRLLPEACPCAMRVRGREGERERERGISTLNFTVLRQLDLAQRLLPEACPRGMRHQKESSSLTTYWSESTQSLR